MHSETPPILVNFLLTALFTIACRWIKRNPSSFLRYTLFPFGGLNVERWPRFMLAVVRICAAFSFFFFFLYFIDLLFPGTVEHPSPAVLYSKFAFCIAVSFFALRGTGEPVEEYETPKFGALPAKQQTPQAAAVPTASQSRPLATVNRAPSGAVINPATTIPTATSPAFKNPVPSASGPGVSAPPLNSSQSRLSDAEAPPVPNRSNPLCAPPPGVVKERLATIGSTFVISAVITGLFYLIGAMWLVYTFLAFFSLAILILFFARNAPVGACPFCGGLIQRYNRLRPEPVRCDKCGEISKFENERFSPYNPGEVSEKPIFRSALFENAFWPNGCVQCGAPPTRFDTTQAVRYQARRLATPLVSSLVLPHPAARATGVPYCAQHRDAIQVIAPKEMFGWTPWQYLPGYEERMANRRRASLLWRSLPMLRRYLEANRRAKSGVSTGYREPNLFQKTVSEAFAKPSPARADAAAAAPPPNKAK